MAHVAHFPKASVRGLANEWTRDKKYKDREGRIDVSRSRLNYAIDKVPKQGLRPKSTPTLMGYLNKRLKQLPHRERKDLTVVSDWVITCPQELLGDDKQVKRFFEVSYQFVCDRYGRDNVIQGFVHMDETTPHMHVPVIPFTGETISRKKLFTRKELSDFHKELDKLCEIEFGKKGLILNGRTKGNYTQKELSERTRRENELKAREIAVKRSESDLEKKHKKLDVEIEKTATEQNRAKERQSEYETLIANQKAYFDEEKERLEQKAKEQVKAYIEGIKQEQRTKARRAGERTPDLSKYDTLADNFKLDFGD